METMLQLEQVKNELMAMKLMYPHSQMTAASIEITAPIWLEDCTNEGMSAKDFFEACSLARRDGTAFPTIGRVVKAHRDLMSSTRLTRNPELPPPPQSEEQRQRSLERCRGIISMLESKKRSPENKRVHRRAV